MKLHEPDNWIPAYSSMSRNFNSGRSKDNYNIKVVGVIEKAESNQLGFQSHDGHTSRAFHERIRGSYTKICFQAFGVG